MSKKKKSPITVLEAVDTLSHLADLNTAQPGDSGWLDPAKLEENQELVQETFRTINSYLQHMYHKDRQELHRLETQKGLQSMMQLAGEAADKVGQYSELFQGAHLKDESISEFKKLRHFYLSKVFSKGQKESQEESWELEHETPGIDDEARQILKDLDMVRHDQNYELFYMTHDDGTPFFTSNLLRHLRMVGNFDETYVSGERENLLSHLDLAYDRDVHLSAQKILQECSDLIDLFYKQALQHKEDETIMELSKAVMSLLLAANPKNLMHNAAGKSALNYWNDFILYLRMSLGTEGYAKWRSSSKLSDIYAVTLKLMHRICNALFLRVSPREADLEMIHSWVGSNLTGSIWDSVAQAETQLLNEFQKVPSGPVMKTLKMFRLQDEKHGFDPICQGNAPFQLFTLMTDALHTSVIHMAAPVHQITLDRGVIAGEFKGYLQGLGKRRHFYINLQDFTSWKEQHRSTLLQALSEKGEFSHQLFFMTLAKDTDFYYQINRFSEVTDSQQFCKSCVEEILGGVEKGFYFPPGKSPKAWLDSSVRFVHLYFFEGAPALSRKERLDFIEILYFFIILRYLEDEKPDVLNFSCKDGIDTGASTVAAFFGFSRLLSSKNHWTEHERDFFLFAFFMPALWVRHRSIDSRRLHRALSALEHFEYVLKRDREKVLKGCAKLLPELSLKEIQIKDVA